MGWITDILKDVPVSAALKERLALQEEKSTLALAEKEADNARLKSENEVLKADTARLQADNARLQADKERLELDNANLHLQLEKAIQENRIHQQGQQQPSHGSDLSEEEQRILVCLAERDERLTAQGLCDILSFTKLRMDYYLQKLKTAEYIWGLSLGDPMVYGLNQKAREYLIAQGLM